jgi:pyruvate dehydrogenase E2 component (dihydrolipoamide acetyltransferase)
VETDKATMGFEVQEKGFLAKTLDSSETIALGTPLAVVTKKAADIAEFASYTFGASPASSQPVAAQSTPNPTPTPAPSTSPTTAPTASSPATNAQTHTNADRVIASPLAKTVASERGIDLSQVNGSGPNGRVIRQDVDAYVAPKPVATETKKEQVV